MIPLSDIQPVIDRLLAEEAGAKAEGAAKKAERNGKAKGYGKVAGGYDLADDALLAKAIAAKNGADFLRLWQGDTSAHGGDHSRAVAALVERLVFWCGPGSVADRADRLFRRSRLFNAKWDERHRGDGATYGTMTIEKALGWVQDADRYQGQPSRVKVLHNRKPFSPAVEAESGTAAVTPEPGDNAPPAAAPAAAGGESAPPPDDLPRAWDNPLRLAELVAKRVRLLCHGKTWFEYSKTHYGVASDNWVEAHIRAVCEDAAVAEYEKNALAVAEKKSQLTRVRDALKAAELAGGLREQLEAKEAKLLKEMEKAARHEGFVPDVTSRLVSDATGALRGLCQVPDDTKPNSWLTGAGPRVLSCENGLIDLDALTLLPHSPDWFGMATIPVRFDKDAPPPTRFLGLLNEIMEGDQTRVDVLLELAGACLDPGLVFKHFAVLAGDGDNGKTVYLTVLRALLGDGNHTSVTLQKLGERFGTWPLFGKLANLVGDQGYIASRDEGRLKELTGGEPVPFEQKGKDVITALNSAKQIFACNTPPTFADKTNAVWNRLVIMPFEYVVQKERQNAAYLLAETWANELPGILNCALAGLTRFRANNHRLTFAPKCDAAAQQHRVDSNPALAFLLEHYQPGPPDSLVMSGDLYDGYGVWCKKNGYKFHVCLWTFTMRPVPPARTSGP